MSNATLSLAELYKGWDTYQERLVKAVRPLTAEQLALRAAPHLRPIGDLIAHIILVRAGWFFFVLNEQDPRLAQFGGWADAAELVKTADELVDGLETTWAVIHERLQRWTVEDLEPTFWDADDEGNPEGPYSRQWVLWHLVEHDMHHGGELSFTLGMHQIPAVSL
ncbi:MAG TPA: DinB family protein [Roseiflexaceae bacterium]|nr:DinB family protein [Roseiflexaceae bacterium]